MGDKENGEDSKRKDSWEFRKADDNLHKGLPSFTTSFSPQSSRSNSGNNKNNNNNTNSDNKYNNNSNNNNNNSYYNNNNKISDFGFDTIPSFEQNYSPTLSNNDKKA